MCWTLYFLVTWQQFYFLLSNSQKKSFLKTEKNQGTEKVKAFYIPFDWRVYQKELDSTMDKMKCICYLVMNIFLLKCNLKF